MNATAAATLLAITGVVAASATYVLLPVARRLGALLEAMTEDRIERREHAPEMAQVRDLLTTIDQRLSLLEERQEFAEALLAHGDPKLLSVQAPAPREHN